MSSKSFFLLDLYETPERSRTRRFDDIEAARKYGSEFLAQNPGPVLVYMVHGRTERAELVLKGTRLDDDSIAFVKPKKDEDYEANRNSERRGF